MTIFGGLPLYLSEQNIRFVDAVFESASGLTTTGSTVLVGLDTMPPGLLLWRSLLNMLGGIGVVVLALAVLPMLQIGGMQLFKMESSDTTEKMLPRTTQIATAISIVLTALTALCALCYVLAGMSGFDAINHAMSTIATGGHSTHDASFMYFKNPAIEWVGIVFMISGGLPIILYFQIFRGKPLALLQNSQVQWFLTIIAGVTLTLTVWLVLWRDAEPVSALRSVLFNVVSVITTTGFSSTDYASWGSFATFIFFMITVIGGCTGSTAGGIKVFRLQILFQTANAQIRGLIHPHGVFLPRYNGKPITDQVSASVMSFIVLFGMTFTVVALGLSAYDLDFITCMSGAAQALSNVGPGLGSIIGPVGNFSSLPDGAKWILTFAMILGRLELFTVLVLLSPKFWND